ncbi:hypothetical protein [Enterobacter kobei]|uniref:hypothetical protein n=1 Tax=Enterobacter kobei TaxID=208224 RepID=UPI0022E2DA58|nr:hypothetical protein [Enterobacter kobei]
MDLTYEDLKQQRLQKLFHDCQQQVLSQIIGPFGLSTAMFEDRNGGNVTTMHNFEREESDFIADKDMSSHAKSREDYQRKEYESKDFTKKSVKLRPVVLMVIREKRPTRRIWISTMSLH